MIERKATAEIHKIVDDSVVKVSDMATALSVVTSHIIPKVMVRVNIIIITPKRLRLHITIFRLFFQLVPTCVS